MPDKSPELRDLERHLTDAGQLTREGFKSLLTWCSETEFRMAMLAERLGNLAQSLVEEGPSDEPPKDLPSYRAVHGILRETHDDAVREAEGSPAPPQAASP